MALRGVLAALATAMLIKFFPGIFSGGSDGGFARITFTVVVAGIASLAVERALRYCFAQPRHGPFGPRVPMKPTKLPFIGHMLDMNGPGDANNSIDGLIDLGVKHADPRTGLSSFFIFNKPIISVLRHDHCREVLTKSTHREKLPFLDKHMQKLLGPKALVLLMGKEWKAHRKIAGKAFAFAHLRGMVDDMARVGGRLADHIARHYADGGGGGDGGEGKAFDAFQTLKLATLDTIGLTAFGYNFDCLSSKDTPPFAKAFEFMLDEQLRRMYALPWPSNYWYGWPTQRNRRHAAATRVVRGTLRDIIARRRAARAKAKASIGEGEGEGGAKGEAEHEDLLRYMLDAADEEGDGSDTSDSTLSDNLLTLLFGGFDTTSILLCYTLYLLSLNPDVAARAAAEVDEVLGGGGGGGGRLPTYEDVGKLGFVQAVLMEALRLYPPAPLTVRTTTKPMSLSLRTRDDDPSSADDLLDVPVGTLVWVPVWAVHRSPLNWVDGDKFDPERFLSSPATDASAGKSARRGGADLTPSYEFRHQFAHIAFSAGPRNCVGKRFAMLEGTVLLATLLQRFTFRLSPKTVVPVRAIGSGPVQKPEGGMWVIPELRGESATDDWVRV